MNSKYLPITFLAVICGILYSSAVWAADKPLFTEKSPIHAVLTAPVTQVYRQRKQDVRLYFDATFSYKAADQTNQKLGVKVRTRGNFRRLNCEHPPLRLNFVKKANDNTLFEKQNKLKLVGPCKRGRAYQELLSLEYLAYQIWEQVSDFHFKTRLIDLNYLDTDKRKKPWSSTTFVIEDEDDMAKRLDRKVMKVGKINRQQMNFEQTALVELFQLLIGNTDYSTLTGPAGNNCCHNSRLLVSKGASNNVIPVPYDFDISGLVNAPYAVPAAQYPIDDVRQRYFSGWCKEDRHFETAIQRFNDRKTAIYQTLQSIDLLASATLRKTTHYLDRFYTQINDQARVKKEIIGRCRGRVIEG